MARDKRKRKTKERGSKASSSKGARRARKGSRSSRAGRASQRSTTAQMSRGRFIRTAGIALGAAGAAAVLGSGRARATAPMERGATTVQDIPTYFAPIFLTFPDEDTGYLSSCLGFDPSTWELRPYLNKSNEVTLPNELGVCPVCPKDVSTFRGDAVPTVVYGFGPGEYGGPEGAKEAVFWAFLYGDEDQELSRGYAGFTQLSIDAFYGFQQNGPSDPKLNELKAEYEARFDPISYEELLNYIVLVPVRLALFDYWAGRMLPGNVVAKGFTTQKIMAQTVKQKFAAAYGNGAVYEVKEEGGMLIEDPENPLFYGMSTTGNMALVPVFTDEANFPNTVLPTGSAGQPYPDLGLTPEQLFALYPGAIPDIAYPPKHLRVTLDDMG
jgi:hypothetical protein